MQISDKAKERFKRDCNLPLRLFVDPYFTQRLTLYDAFYNTLPKWNAFVNELRQYPNEEEYFAEYNIIKERAMETIKTSEAFIRFSNQDMSQYVLINKGFPSKDVFHPSNIGRCFISIDMKKANFSSLRHYDASMFGADTWEEFIGKFTESEYIQSSKYIREVILGNCNPKRHITYEKHLMDNLLTKLLVVIVPDMIVSFSNDEIVIDITNIPMEDRRNVFENIRNVVFSNAEVPFRIEPFQLIGIIDATNKKIFGYMRKIRTDEESMDFKGLNNYILPFVMRKLLNQDVQPEDMVFEHEGMLATFMSPPIIEFVSKYEN